MLLHNLRIIAPLSHDAVNDLSVTLQKTAYDAKEFLIFQNNQIDKSWLHVDGMLRHFVYIDGLEATTAFTGAGASIINHALLSLNMYANENIQALQPLTAWVLTKQDQLTLFGKHPTVEKLFLLLQHQQNNARMADEHNLRESSGMHKYQYMLNKFPDIHHYTTRDQLISYLKISKNTYYKLRTGQ